MQHFMAAGFPVLLALGAVLGLAGWRDGSLLYRADYSIVTFRKRRSLRAAMLTLSFILGIGGPYFAWQNLRERPVQPSAARPEGELAGNVAQVQSTTVIGIGLGVALLGFCIPEELRLDPDRRTYRLTKGWPPFAKVRSGSYDDIAGIYVKWLGSGVYLVCLGYGYPAGAWTLLGIAGKRRRAECLADELAAQLALSQVAAPVQAGLR